MTREEVKKILPIIEAFAEGKTIQTKWVDGTWKDIENDDIINLIRLLKYNQCSRIKPETKYRPFKDVEECWHEMQKHQPFGWTKSILEKRFYFISKIDDTGCFFSNEDNVSFRNLFASDTFADGTPFGMKDE